MVWALGAFVEEQRLSFPTSEEQEEEAKARPVHLGLCKPDPPSEGLLENFIYSILTLRHQGFCLASTAETASSRRGGSS